MDYTDRRWIRKRKSILRRDKYLCKECSRYGKTTPANTVHHISPVESHPELWLSDWNLISLCSSCHNGMHDRVTNELTIKGLELLNRSNPPCL